MGEDEEEEEAAADEDEEDGEGKAKNEMIFLAGRLYREDIEIRQPPAPEPKDGEEAVPQEKMYKTKWIYERWNKVVNSSEFYDVAGQLGDILKRSRREIMSNKERVREAKMQVMKAAEEKKALLAQAALKK